MEDLEEIRAPLFPPGTNGVRVELALLHEKSPGTNGVIRNEEVLVYEKSSSDIRDSAQQEICSWWLQWVGSSLSLLIYYSRCRSRKTKKPRGE